MMGWYGNWGHMSVWGWTAMWLSGVLVLVLLGAIVLLLVRLSGSRPADRSPGPRAPEPRAPEQVLGERFARGDIDEDEYRRRLDVLGERHTTAP